VRVLVTGGAGYIGSVVAEELVAGGHEVVVLDNLSKGHRDAVPAGAALVVGDIAETDLVERTLADRGVQSVVHMAAVSIVGESVKDPARYYRENVAGGLSLLDAMRGAGVRSLVFSSTAAVYGEPAKQPIAEDDATVPTSPYGESKLAFERMLRWYDGAYGLRSVSLRYFNAAGATATRGERHHPETHLIPLVLEAAATGGVVPIFGDDYPTRDGTCVRDYIHVVDLAHAHVLAVAALAAGAPSATYNLGCGGDGYTVREVIGAAERVTGRPVHVRVTARRPGDPAVLIAASDRIRAGLGWRPRHQDLVDIISSGWAFMERHRR
jgi:UDP-glucose 4-epimerase